MYTYVISLRLDEDTYSKLLGLAGRNGKQISNFLREIIKEKTSTVNDRMYTHKDCDAKLSLKQPFCHKCNARLDWSGVKG